MKKQLPNLIALAVIYVAVLAGWQSVWGVLFIMWTIPALVSGEVHLITRVRKRENPLLFWSIIITWIGLSLFLLFADLIPAFS